MTVAAGAELGGHVLDHLGVERLVDGDEDAAHQQRGDQILGADFELLGQVLYADAFGDRDLAGDGQRLVAVLHAAITWRRHKALHRAFFGLGILLLATAAAARRSTLRARCFARRRCAAGAWARAKAGTRRSKAWTCAEAGTCAGSAWRRRGKPPGVVRVGCLGRGPPANWPGGAATWSALRGLGCRAACRPAIEDWFAALQSGRRQLP